MHPYLRFAAAMTRSLRASRIGALDEARIALRVAPQDVEVRRMNNGRYLTMMDIGRFDLAVRTGLGRAMIERRWQPLVRAATIDFRRSLELGQRYALATRIVSFDERYFYMQQRFIRSDRDARDVALAFVTVVIRAEGHTLAPREVLAAVGHHDAPPPLPHAVALWAESLAAQRA